MELRRAADAILRCQVSPLVAAVRWQAGRQIGKQSSSSNSVNISRRRTFITTTPKYALRPSATTTAAPPPESQSAQDGKSASAKVEEAAKNLGWLQGSGSRSGASRFPAPRSQDGGARARELRMNGGNSADDILKTINTFSSPSGKSSFDGIDISRMADPFSDRPESATDLMGAINREVAPPREERIPLRLNPSTGRTINIGGNIDVGRGFRLLEQSCARNRVRSDFTKQRFHERGGLKRKRLRRERWRRRFMEGFKATVARVKHLKTQGW